MYYFNEVNILICLILVIFVMCSLFIHCYYVKKYCLNFEFENEQHNSKFKEDKIKKIIPILKKCTWYFLAIIISLICGALIAFYFPNLMINIKNMIELIISVIFLILLIFITIKISGLSIEKLKSSYKKNKKSFKYFLSFELLLLVIIPLTFDIESTILKTNFKMSSSDYFNFLGVVLTSEFAFFSLKYQLSATRQDEKEMFIRREVITGMDTITGAYKAINDSLTSAQDEWNQNTRSSEYSSLNFEKMRTFLIGISNYNFTCQQKNELFIACKFDSISDKIKKFGSEVSKTLTNENTIISQLSEKEGKIDSYHREKITLMNDDLKKISDLLKDLNKEINHGVLDLKVNNKKIKPRFERV